MAAKMTLAQHYLKLAEEAVRAAETADDLDSFRFHRDQAAMYLSQARTCDRASTCMPARAAEPIHEPGIVPRNLIA